MAGPGGPPPPGHIWNGTRWVRKPAPRPFVPSAEGLTPQQYRAKLAGARALFGHGSPQVQALRTSWGLRAPAPVKAFGANDLPPGTYDISLDQQLEAARRGNRYTQEDLSLAGTRSSDDFQQGLARIMENRGHDTAALERGYQRLGNTQYEAARASGAARGGALAAALSKRSANQALEQADITTNYDRQQAGLSQEFARGVEDRSIQSRRSGQELGFFEGDIGGLKLQSAKQAGFEIPNQPVPYRAFKSAAGVTWYRLPNGTVTKRKPKLNAQGQIIG